MRIIRFGKRYGIGPSKQYKVYEEEFKRQCIAMHLYGKKYNGRYNVKSVYYMNKDYISDSSNIRIDLGNLQNATCDCLVASQILEDDNCRIVCSQDGSRVDYDKKNPRVEIEITEKERK